MSAAVQSRKAVFAHFTSEQTLLFGFAEQSGTCGFDQASASRWVMSGISPSLEKEKHGFWREAQ